MRNQNLWFKILLRRKHFKNDFSDIKSKTTKNEKPQDETILVLDQRTL